MSDNGESYPWYSNIGLMDEGVRLETFRSWPSNAPPITNDLAKDGFYYTEEDDRVICNFCDVELGQWILKHSPSVRHRDSAPHCPMVRSDGVTMNVPLFVDVHGTPPLPFGNNPDRSSDSDDAIGGNSGLRNDGANFIPGVSTGERLARDGAGTVPGANHVSIRDGQHLGVQIYSKLPTGNEASNLEQDLENATNQDVSKDIQLADMAKAMEDVVADDGCSKACARQALQKLLGGTGITVTKESLLRTVRETRESMRQTEPTSQPTDGTSQETITSYSADDEWSSSNSSDSGRSSSDEDSAKGNQPEETSRETE